MFENTPEWQDGSLTLKNVPIAKTIQDGPFLFEKVVNLKRQTKKKNIEWSLDSNLRYLACIHVFKDDFAHKKGRQVWSIFKKMSIFINTRNTNQCRIHHKRMLREHDTIQGILSHHSQLILRYSSSFHHYVQQVMDLSRRYQLRETTKNHHPRLQKSVIIGDKNRSDIKNVILKKQHSSELAAEDSKKIEENIPTDVAYPQQINNDSSNIRSNRNGYLQYCHPMMNQFSQFLFNPPLQQQTNDKPLTQDKKKQWKDCHQLFLAWTTKLHSLLYS